METQEKRKLLSKIRLMLEKEAVLVEGKKDVSALATAGFTVPRIIAVQGTKPERIVGKLELDGTGVLLLFDFDDEGKRKEAAYEAILASYGIPVDRPGRKAFRALFRVRTVEDLPHAMAELRKEG
jgi:5S rRNA maturation endonuclease (ribonuclease M5)